MKTLAFLLALTTSVCVVADEPVQDAQIVPAATVETAAVLVPYRDAAIERWEDDVVKLEQLDASETRSEDSLLIIGSSSIRLWEDADVLLAPYRVIRRGYGGAKYSDVAVFAKRLIEPHQYRGLVMFVGNDVAGKPEDHSPEEVEKLVRYIVSVSQHHQPGAPVLLIEVTPTPQRFAAWPKIRKLNAMLREVALSTPDVYFIATAGHVLDPTGTPRSELFRDDNLHLSEQGYELWSGLIRRRLNEVFLLDAKFHAVKQSAVAH